MSRNFHPTTSRREFTHQLEEFRALPKAEQQRLYDEAGRRMDRAFRGFWIGVFCILLLILWAIPSFAWSPIDAYVNEMISPGNLTAGFAAGVIVALLFVALFNFVLKHWMTGVKLGILALLSLSILAFLGVI